MSSEGEAGKWKLLCGVLDVDTEDLAATRCQYKLALAGIHVNIFDLLQHVRTGAAGLVRRFGNVKELARYSKRRGRIFPREQAKGGALRVLLRVLFGSGRGG